MTGRKGGKGREREGEGEGGGGMGMGVIAKKNTLYRKEQGGREERRGEEGSYVICVQTFSWRLLSDVLEEWKRQ